MTPVISSINVFEILNKYKSSLFVFVEPGGNHGDFLIYRGAKKIFDALSITYKSVNHLEFMSLDITHDAVVYINGGGAFNELWMQRPIDDFIKAVNSSAKTVILGPTSFTKNIDFLKDRVFSKIGNITNKEIVVFCREEFSYSILKKVIPSNIELLIDHDTALNLSAKDLIKEVPKGKHVLYAIREDKEQYKFERLDLLSFWIDPIVHCKSFEDWVNLHANSQKIVTNRLHSSILSLILGKNVTLLPNSYFKNRSVWEYSLKERGVLWQDKIEVSAPASFLMRSKFYKWIGNSYKVKKLCKKFYGLE